MGVWESSLYKVVQEKGDCDSSGAFSVTRAGGTKWEDGSSGRTMRRDKTP